ncbi:PREDICTED: pleckstrin homology domain-containing family G member 4B isoform X2 [Aptenodytes forsteri]|uniref:pleckstrin homology domain-containing family G member 4B isoform X2 n=1 Tax=Aptenodytes forsteri TaxID=9233 RepID=UPI0004F4A0A2|nr:PREDICTED: pleckstrin homology domain-containing family G member 4B isoform X2 [Aptenodytes forsteri]
MKLVLEEALLVTLRLKGGTVLARLRKEEFCHTEHYRDAMEFVTRLYNQVDEEVHRLVLLSNKCLQQLGNLGEAINFEEDCDQQYYGKGVQLVQDDSSLNMEEKVQILEKYLSNIIIQTERRKTELTKLVNLCEFYEMVREICLHLCLKLGFVEYKRNQAGTADKLVLLGSPIQSLEELKLEFGQINRAFNCYHRTSRSR